MQQYGEPKTTNKYLRKVCKNKTKSISQDNRMYIYTNTGVIHGLWYS